MQTGSAKKTTIHKITTVALSFLCCCLLLAPVTAYSSAASIVIDADTGNIIHENNPNQLWFPASLTKVMTLYLVFRALKNGQIHLQDKLTVSKLTAKQLPFRLGLLAGNSLTIEQAILAVATRSANDAAFLLAEHQAKSEKRFALKMTIQAKALGMNNTKFYNATGLPNGKQVTTARDMAVLARAILHDFPEYYKYFSTPSFTYKKRSYSNINGFLNAYSGADGIKTGFTCGSGYNLIASAKRNNKRLIAIVMGAKNGYTRTKEIKALLDKGFTNVDANTASKNITEPQPETLKPAIYLLSTTQCNQTYTASSYRNRISGWTVVFGAFVKKSQAKELLRKVRPKMKRLAKYGHPVILKHMKNGVFLWHAFWSGLKKKQAGQICKTLWKTGEYCRALHPMIFSKK